MQPHDSTTTERRFIYSLLLTAFILVVELIGGYWTGSLALLSDAAHVFMDIFALALSFIALKLSSLPPDDRHTYGYHRLEVLAALANGITLGIIALGIWREAWIRWQEPQTVRSLEMLIIAVLGLSINLIVAYVLRGSTQTHTHSGGTHAHTNKDLNLQSAFLHVLGDAISSVGVILAAIFIKLTNWQWIDPLASALIGALILLSSYRVMRSSLHILVEGTPEGLSAQQVGQVIQSVPGVTRVHDLHIWNICSGHVALSAHVVMDTEHPQDHLAIMVEIRKQLRDQYGIEHTTIQIDSNIDGESDCGGDCG